MVIVHKRGERAFRNAVLDLEHRDYMLRYESFRVNLGATGTWYTLIMVKDEGVESQA